MLKLTIAAALFVVALGQYGPPRGYSAPAPSHGGYSSHEDYAQPIPYQYGFDVAGGDHHTGDFKQTRHENGDGHGNVQGSYGYTDAHGNYRQVDYVADAHGFRAQVKTNEPGTENQNPADVDLQAQAPQHYAQPAAYGSAPRAYGRPAHY